MSSQDERISRALRELAAESPQAPPPELGARVKDAFARHHAARRTRRRRSGLAAALVTSLVIALLWARSGKPVVERTATNQLPVPQGRISADAEPAKQAGMSASGAKQEKRHVVHRKSVASPGPDVASNDFIALASFDPAIPRGQSRIVRVELSGTELRLAGYPVNDELMGNRLATDLLVGQDGRPYAARLVQTRVVH